MVTIQCEYRTRMILGWADCKVEKTVYNRLRDIDTVEEVVQWCKKAFNSASISDPCITFTFNDGSLYGRSTGRVYRLYGSQHIVKWDEFNGTDQYDIDKVTARTFKTLYLECADKYIEKEGA